MTKRLSVLIAVLCASMVGVVVCQPAFATQSTGQLTYGLGGTNGLVASGWSAASISWDITMSAPRTYNYQYTFTTYGSGGGTHMFSHLVLETTSGEYPVTLPDLQTPQWLSPTGWAPLTIAEVDWAKASSNPNLPGSFYGAKIEAPTSLPNVLPTVFTWRFTSTRTPVWGDFYAKDGFDDPVWVDVYNVGFGSPDVDPSANLVTSGNWGTNPLVDGTYHIVRPDGGTGGGWNFDGGATPELSTWTLLACTALFGVGYMKRRRTP